MTPQIAIAIGQVLTSNRGGERRTTLADWTWHQGATAGCKGRGVVGCHCSVLWLGERVTTNSGGVDVVPLPGAIARCHCSALLLWGEGDDQLWRSTWCHCRVPL